MSVVFGQFAECLLTPNSGASQNRYISSTLRITRSSPVSCLPRAFLEHLMHHYVTALSNAVHYLLRKLSTRNPTTPPANRYLFNKFCNQRTAFLNSPTSEINGLSHNRFKERV